MTKQAIDAIVADAMKQQIPAIVSMTLATQNQQVTPTPVTVRPPAVTVNPSTGKIAVGTAAKAVKAPREDGRIPETIIVIANAGQPDEITVGYSKPFKDKQGRTSDFGFGVSYLDPTTGKRTTEYHKAATWTEMASDWKQQLSAVVVKAITERYE